MSAMNNFTLAPEAESSTAGLSRHERSDNNKDEWLTPPEILKPLGAFDLDPCAPVVRPWSMAAHHYTWKDNGLVKPWHGRVWCNPPYGAEAPRWLGRLAEHGDGIALIFARTETDAWFSHIWPCAHAVLFIRGRITFCHVTGKRGPSAAGAPSALIAYGANNVEVLRNSGIDGKLIELRAAEDASGACSAICAHGAPQGAQKTNGGPR